MKTTTSKKTSPKPKVKTRPYDVANYLKTDEDCALYLEAVIQESDGNGEAIACALGDIARARGMTQIARDTGISREGLYKALSGEGNPAFDTILKVVNALGLRLHATTAQKTRAIKKPRLRHA